MLRKALKLLSAIGPLRFVGVLYSAALTRVAGHVAALTRPFGLDHSSWALRILSRQASDRGSIELFEYWLPRLLLSKTPRILIVPDNLKNAFVHLIPFIHPNSKVFGYSDARTAQEAPTEILLAWVMLGQAALFMKEMKNKFQPSYSNSTFALLNPATSSRSQTERLNQASQAIDQAIAEADSVGSEKVIEKHGMRYLVRTNTMDSNIIEEVRHEYFSMLKPEPNSLSTVLDIGAQIGSFSTQVAKYVSADGKIFAFEPEPDNFRILTENIKLNELSLKIEAVAAAVSNVDGKATLYISTDNTGGNKLGVPEPSSRKEVQVPTIDACRFVSALSSKVDLIKIDVEGWELPILRSLRPQLSNVKALIGELQNSEFGAPADAIKLLQSEGFQVETRGDPAQLIFYATRLTN